MKETYDIRVILQRDTFVDSVESLRIRFGDPCWDKAINVLAEIVVVHAVRAADQDERCDSNIGIDLANSAM